MSDVVFLCAETECLRAKRRGQLSTGKQVTHPTECVARLVERQDQERGSSVPSGLLRPPCLFFFTRASHAGDPVVASGYVWNTAMATFIMVPMDAGGNAAVHQRARRVRVPIARGLGKAYAANTLRALPWELLPNGDPTLPLCVLEAVYAPLLHCDAAVHVALAGRHEIDVDKLDEIEQFVDDDSGIDFATPRTVATLFNDFRTLLGMLATGEWDDPRNVLLLTMADLTGCAAASNAAVNANATTAMVQQITFGELQPHGRLSGFSLMARLGGNRSVVASRLPDGALHSVVAMATFYALGPNPTMPTFMQRHVVISWLLEHEVTRHALPPVKGGTLFATLPDKSGWRRSHAALPSNQGSRRSHAALPSNQG